MSPFPRLAAASAALVACAVASTAMGAQVLAGTSDSYLAGITNADGAIATFEARTTGSLDGTVISRDGRFAYMADIGNGGIAQFARDRTTGVLTALSPALVAVPQAEEPRKVSLSPDGRWLLATTDDGVSSSSHIRVYPVGGDGALGTAVAQASPSAYLGRPVITPDARHVYSASVTGGDWIYMWRLGADGSLTALSPDRMGNGDLSGPCLVMSADGTTLYAPTGRAHTGVGTEVVRWTVDTATGMLSTLDALPFSDGNGGACEGSVTSDGRRLVLAATNPSGNALVRVWPLGDAGVVGAQATSLTHAPTSFTAGLALDPTGHFAYATSRSRTSFTEGGLHQLRVPASGASVIPGVAVGIPTTPWKGVSVAPAQPPVATLASATGRPGAAVRLDASGSTDPDTQIARYDWQFGDGTSARDAGPTPEHVYAAAGEYTARVTVTNAAGCSTDPAGIYNGTMHSCIGGPSATATARVRVEAAAANGASDAGRRDTARPRPLGGTFAMRGRLGTTRGTLPAGATRVSQTARSTGRATDISWVQMARPKAATGKCRVIRRTYTCTIRLTKGTWAVTTTAHGPTGVVAQGIRRVLVRR